MLTIHHVESPEDIATVRALFQEYQASLGIDLCFQDFDAELSALPGAYAPPRGRLLLASSGALPVGCVALRAVDGSRCEMKRLFVRSDARGLGAGRALVARVMGEARTIGYEEVVLDTLPTMTNAQQLYQGLGFRDIPAYRANPVVGTRYLGRSLLEI